MLRERGDAHLAQDEFEQAAACLQEAAALDPVDAGTLVNLGFALCSLSRGPQACEWLERAVELQPGNHDAHYLLGMAREQAGDLAAARECHARVIELNPGFEPATRDLVRLLAQCGEVEQARSVLRQALAAHPDDAILHFYQGNLCLGEREFVAAAEAFERAIALEPGAAQFHSALGQARAGQKQWELAAHSYRRARSVAAMNAQTHNLLGTALVHLGHLEDAVACFRHAVTLEPQYAEAHSNLGNVLRIQGHSAQALEACEVAVRLQPSLAFAHNNLGAALAAENQMAMALASYERAVSLEPGNARFHSNRGGAYQRLGAIEEAITCYRRALDIDPGMLDVRSNLLFALSIAADRTPHEYLTEARTYGLLARAAGSERRNVDIRPAWRSGRPLRVGFVSGDFRNHPVGFFLESTLRSFDRSRLALTAYSTQPVQDDLTGRIRAAFNEWRDVWALDDDQAAQLIRDDNIDLLIDLSGHSQHNRLPLFARRPAPVQASWLGFFASTGVEEIDYYIADPVSAPPEAHSQFTERIWLLPQTRLCFTAPREASSLMPGPLPALRNGYVTFGSYQNASKFNRAVFRGWARILQAVPRSQFRLQGDFGSGEFDPVTALAAEGIPPSRVRLAGLTSRSEYLRSHQQVDLILDTFPYPGGTTTCEALWMGVPTVTLSGSTLIGRQGASLLTCAGLADCVASDVDAFVALAVRWAGDLERLASLRQGLREQVLRSPLFDAARFAEDLQSAFLSMAASR